MNEKICGGDPCVPAMVFALRREAAAKAIDSITQGALKIADAEISLQDSDVAQTIDGQFAAIAATDIRRSALEAIELLEGKLKAGEADMDRCRTCIGIGNCALSS